MPSTITYKPGDVLLVAFPFTDLSAQKKRPCLVVSSSSVSSSSFNDSHFDVIAVAITSQIPEKISSFEFLLSEKDQLACGLPKPSLVYHFFKSDGSLSLNYPQFVGYLQSPNRRN